MMKYVTFKGCLALYLIFGVAARFMMPTDSTTEQWVAYVVALVVLILVDLLSFKQGLRKGLNIADEVLKDLCKEKKIKVVPNV
jgi:hypothetical protein